jgi:hypothetical protein
MGLLRRRRPEPRSHHHPDSAVAEIDLSGTQQSHVGTDATIPTSGVAACDAF